LVLCWGVRSCGRAPFFRVPTMNPLRLLRDRLHPRTRQLEGIFQRRTLTQTEANRISRHSTSTSLKDNLRHPSTQWRVHFKKTRHTIAGLLSMFP